MQDTLLQIALPGSPVYSPKNSDDLFRGPITVRQGSVAVPGGIAQNSAYDTETVTVNCNANEKAISAGTGWSDDAADRELWTQRLTPIVTNNNVTGFRATGGNDSGNSSTFTLYVLCYTG